MSKKLLGSLAVMLLLGAGCTTTGTVETTSDADTSMDSNATDTMMAGDTMNTNDDTMIGMDASADVMGDAMKADVDVTAGEVKEFIVTGGNFTFSPATRTVKKGDTVRVVFKNDEGFHDFVLDEFDVATKQIQGGSEETVEFVADKAGSFEYYCSVGKHRDMGMKGILTVTE